VFDVNLHYVARAVRAALRVFLEQGTGGTIVSVGSIAAAAGSPKQAAYGAAKAGVASLARSVAAEYSGQGFA
jgi:3-oxoacyl-[acyl-carrier protein] reductase